MKIFSVFRSMQVLLFVTGLNHSGGAAEDLAVTWAIPFGPQGRGGARYTSASDPQGNTYAVGFYNSVPFALGRFSLDPPLANSAGFVGKIDRDGSPLWLKNIPASGSLRRSLFRATTDLAGNLYAGGIYSGEGEIAGTRFNSTNSNAFIVKMDSNGEVLWAKSLDSPRTGFPTFLSTDVQGNLIIAAEFLGSVSIDCTSVEAQDSGRFVAKLSSAGKLLWLRFAGERRYDPIAEESDQITGLATDSTGGVYLSGRAFDGSSLGPFTLNSRGSADAFLVHLTAEGEPQWMIQAGGTGFDSVQSIFVDPGGSVVLVGRFIKGSGVIIGETAITGQAVSTGSFVALINAQGKVERLGPVVVYGQDTYPDIMNAVTDSFGNLVLNASFGTTRSTPAVLALGAQRVTAQPNQAVWFLARAAPDNSFDWVGVYSIYDTETVSGVVNNAFENPGLLANIPDGSLIMDGTYRGDAIVGDKFLAQQGDFWNFFVARIVMPLPPPRLQVQRRGDALELSWPSQASAFLLQSNPGLTVGSSWHDVAVEPKTVGDRRVMSVDSTGATTFFRLRSP